MKSSILTFLLILSLSQVACSQAIVSSDEFEPEEVSMVTVRGRFCDVTVGNGPKVYFKGEVSGNNDNIQISSKLKGGELVIVVEEQRGARSWNQSLRGRIELKIPDNTNLMIDNSSGDIYVKKVNTKRVDLEASSGDIKVQDVTAELQVETSSGDIELDGVIGNTETESSSGDQELYRVKGNLSIDATSGDVEVSEFTGDIEVRTTSGEIDLRKGKGAMAFRSSSGNIEGYGLELTDDLLVRASSGNVKMRIVNDLQDINFDLQTSSGNLDVGSRSGDKELYLKRGEGFWVKGITSSGNIGFSN